jgi:hypothetical protein
MVVEFSNFAKRMIDPLHGKFNVPPCLVMETILKMKDKKNGEKEVTSIVFSRNRAMQLDGLLQSFFLHCKDSSRARVSVLYKATDVRHAFQYQVLSAEYAGRVEFREQQHFRRDMLSILNPFATGVRGKTYRVLSMIGSMGFPLGSLLNRLWRRTFGLIQIFFARKFMPVIPDNSYVLFLVDDTIFVRDFLLSNIIDVLNKHNDLIAFSLRLGENTTYCYSQNHLQALPNFINIHHDIAKYDWTKSEYDFGYPFDISSSLYRLKDILPLVVGLPFYNPNTLEERMAYHVNAFRTRYSFLGCYLCSVAFCNPVNIVQTTIPNRVGKRIRYDVNELTERFEQGQRIRVDAYSGFIPNSCHQEVELVFEKRDVLK